MSSSNLKLLLIEYDKKRMQAIYDAEKRKTELYEKEPRLQKIDDELSKEAINISKKMISSKDSNLLNELNNKIKDLKEEKEKILISLGKDNSYLKPNFNSMGSVLEVALPTTLTRIIGTISFFFEPIILTYVLSLNNYSISYITTEYGVINGFVMPILLLPGFFTGAISSALLPVISREYQKKNYNYIRKKLKQALILSLLIGIPATLIISTYPDFFLNMLYKTSHGASYIKKIAFIFILFYIEAPLATFLQATNKAKEVMYDNFIGIILKTVFLFLLSFIKGIGLYSLLIASGINILITSTRHIKHIKILFKTFT